MSLECHFVVFIPNLCAYVNNFANFWQTLMYILVPPPNRAYLRTLIHNSDLEHLEKVKLYTRLHNYRFGHLKIPSLRTPPLSSPTRTL